MLIEVPRKTLPDLNLRPILVYSVGDVLHKKLEMIPLPEGLPTKHIAPLYICYSFIEVCELLVNAASTVGKHDRRSIDIAVLRLQTFAIGGYRLSRN